MPSLLCTKFAYIFGYISWLSILFHWCVFLVICLCQWVLNHGSILHGYFLLIILCYHIQNFTGYSWVFTFTSSLQSGWSPSVWSAPAPNIMPLIFLFRSHHTCRWRLGEVMYLQCGISLSKNTVCFSLFPFHPSHFLKLFLTQNTHLLLSLFLNALSLCCWYCCKWTVLLYFLSSCCLYTKAFALCNSPSSFSHRLIFNLFFLLF